MSKSNFKSISQIRSRRNSERKKKKKKRTNIKKKKKILKGQKVGSINRRIIYKEE